jgi:hypothetical protein
MEGRTEQEREAAEAADIVDWADLEPMETSEQMQPTEIEAKSKIADGLALASFTGLTLGAAALGSVAHRKSPDLWYKMLRKPPFQPPAWVFGPIWTALYGLIATSGYRVWKSTPSQPRARSRAVGNAACAQQRVVAAVLRRATKESGVRRSAGASRRRCRVRRDVAKSRQDGSGHGHPLLGLARVRRPA